MHVPARSLKLLAGKTQAAKDPKHNRVPGARRWHGLARGPLSVPWRYCQCTSSWHWPWGSFFEADLSGCGGVLASPTHSHSSQTSCLFFCSGSQALDVVALLLPFTLATWQEVHCNAGGARGLLLLPRLILSLSLPISIFFPFSISLFFPLPKNQTFHLEPDPVFPCHLFRSRPPCSSFCSHSIPFPFILTVTHGHLHTSTFTSTHAHLTPSILICHLTPCLEYLSGHPPSNLHISGPFFNAFRHLRLARLPGPFKWIFTSRKDSAGSWSDSYLIFCVSWW